MFFADQYSFAINQRKAARGEIAEPET